MRRLTIATATALAVLLLAGPLLATDPPARPTIAVVPGPHRPPAAADVVKLTSGEFELLSLQNYAGPVAWDVTAPDGGPAPVRLVQPKAGGTVIGFRPGQVDPAEYDVPTLAVVVYGKGSGRAVIAAWGVQDGKPAKLATMLVDSNTAPQPPPVPPAPPTPPAPPAPMADRVWLVVIEETAERTPATAKVLADLAFWQSMPAVAGWQILDKDNPVVAKNKYDQFASEAGGMPYLLVLDVSGKRLRAVKLPATTAEIRGIVREVTGK